VVLDGEGHLGLEQALVKEVALGILSLGCPSSSACIVAKAVSESSEGKKRDGYTQRMPLSRQRKQAGPALSHFRFAAAHWTQVLRSRRIREGNEVMPGGFLSCEIIIVVALDVRRAG
jgi:hypothetical protein